MARTLSSTQEAAQQAVSATPYIRIYVNSTDYWSRLLRLEHHEEAYRDYATIILRNDDRALTTDFVGMELYIGYGHHTGSGDEYSNTPTLWVKDQQYISLEGKSVVQLYCEGMWDYMREQRVITVGSTPYYDYEWTTSTPYAIMEHLIETAMSWTLLTLGGGDDGIIDTFVPVFALNTDPYENAAAVLYRLIWMTKCYLRAGSAKQFEVVYPQDTDDVDQIYYSDQAHYFHEYVEKTGALVPNSIAVFCNQDADGGWTAIITGTDSNAAEIAKYTTILAPFLAASIDNQTDADNRAAAILSKVRMEELMGRLVIPHDASVELYDKVFILDKRGY